MPSSGRPVAAEQDPAAPRRGLVHTGSGIFCFFHSKRLSAFVWPSVNIFHDLLFACRHCRATSVQYDGIQRVWESRRFKPF